MNIPKPRREKNAAYLAYVRSLPCLAAPAGDCCDAVEAHHVPPIGGGKVGSKTDDRRTAPLCGYHHRWYHTMGKLTFEVVYLLDLEREIARIQRQFKPLTPRKSRVRVTPKLREITVDCRCGQQHHVPKSKVELSGSALRYWCQRQRDYLEVQV